MLGGLRLVLAAGLQVGHQRHVDVEGVVAAHIPAHLADGLQEGLALDVADGAADLRDDDVRVAVLAHPVDEALDLVGDVGDGLDGLAQIPALALPPKDVGVDLAGGQVGVPVQVLVDEPLVVAKIEIGLRPVLGHVHLPVLIGAHGARVHVDVGVQLLGRHPVPPCLQQPPQGGCRDALPQARDHAAGHKNVLHPALLLPVIKGEGRLSEGSYPYGRTPLRSSLLCPVRHASSVFHLGVFQVRILYTNNIARSISGPHAFVKALFCLPNKRFRSKIVSMDYLVSILRTCSAMGFTTGLRYQRARDIENCGCRPDNIPFR